MERLKGSKPKEKDGDADLLLRKRRGETRERSLETYHCKGREGKKERNVKECEDFFCMCLQQASSAFLSFLLSKQEEKATREKTACLCNSQLVVHV